MKSMVELSKEVNREKNLVDLSQMTDSKTQKYNFSVGDNKYRVDFILDFLQTEESILFPDLYVKE